MTDHLIIWPDRSELRKDSGSSEVFLEGKSTAETAQRYKAIKTALDEGFLVNLIDKELDDPEPIEGLSEAHMGHLDSIVTSVTSEVGRAVVGLSLLQLTIKAISPEQSIRLHKGSANSNSFSWKGGLSMRVLDKSYITPVLREKGLLKLNQDGFMMTRTLAENYPYTTLYKARVKGARIDWLAITDALESGELAAEAGLRYLVSILINRTDRFKELTETALSKADVFLAANPGPEAVYGIMEEFITKAEYGARVFEVVIHSAYQALAENGHIGGFLKPLSQMRSANKKHGNVGDIELLATEAGMIIEEAWDAKYGKTHLREELEELSDKLAHHPNCRIAGFITDKAPDCRDEIMRSIADVEALHNCDVFILSFANWHAHIVSALSDDESMAFHRSWMTALVESFGQRRREQAPIDEPCEDWINEIIEVLPK